MNNNPTPDEQPAYHPSVVHRKRLMNDIAENARQTNNAPIFAPQKENKWEGLTPEEHIDRIFSRAHIPEYANDAKYPIVNLIHSLIREARERGYEKARKNKAPMGISQWRAHGKEYGYWEFFEKEVRAAILKEIEKEIDNELRNVQFVDKFNDRTRQAWELRGAQKAYKVTLSLLKDKQTE